MAPGDYLVITFNASISICGVWEENQVTVGGYSICESVTDTDYASVYGECPERYDYGDAPSPYPTLLADNGARHGGFGGPFAPYMGAGVDQDNDGQPTATADGDDTDEWDDEDGVTFMYPWYPGDTGWVNISMIQTPFGGYLNAWVDFNHDGDWADNGEHIITDDYLENGSFYELSFSIPEDAVPGDTYARFRISTQEGLSYDGVAPDGEVEDYLVNIACTQDMEVTKLVWNASKGDWADEYTASYLEEIVEFNITIHNNAECCDLTNISVLDILPNGLEYYSTCGVYYDDILLTPEGNYTFEENNGYLWWNFTNDGLASSVPYCHHIYIYFSAQVTGTGDLINRVKVTVDCGDTKDICESDDAVVNYEEQPCEPTYSVTKETWCYSSQMWWSYGYARSNDNHAKFRIRFNNTGTCDITDKIIIKDELPIELYYNNEYNIVAPSGITIDENEIYYNPSTHTVYFNFTGILQPGENITLILEADYDGDGSSGYEENWVYGSLEETTPIPAHSGIYFNKLGDQ